MTRTKLADRPFPNYTHGEETMNTVTHIVGGGLGLLAALLCILRSAMVGSSMKVVTSCIYGASLIALYTVSSVYHGLPECYGKKVMQVIDHCTIYFLIAGSYTPVALCALAPEHPLMGWGLFAFQWILAAIAVTLTAIDLKKYNVFSMICYIGMGWSIILFLNIIRPILTEAGFSWMLWGGIAYTVGAVLYGIGSKKAWFHSIFHIFVVLGSVLQFVSIFLYIL